MPMKYKIDVQLALKNAGYSTFRLRKENLLSEGALTSIRKGEPISWRNIEKICELLGCQPGDILEMR